MALVPVGLDLRRPVERTDSVLVIFDVSSRHFPSSLLAWDWSKEGRDDGEGPSCADAYPTNLIAAKEALISSLFFSMGISQSSHRVIESSENYPYVKKCFLFQ